MPGRGAVTIELACHIRQVDEFGLTLATEHFLEKNINYQIGGGLVESITGVREPLSFRVTSTWIDTNTGGYGAFAEFDNLSDGVKAAVRGWLANHATA